MPHSQDRPALVLFRDDLRVADHPALHAAVASGQKLLCLYLVDEESEGRRPLGGAARWWVHHAVQALAERLGALGGRLDILRGATVDTLERVAIAANASSCYLHRRYGATERATDAALTDALEARGVTVHAFNGALIHEPGAVLTGAGTPFRVFTPYRRAHLALGPGDAPLPAPRAVEAATLPAGIDTMTLDALAWLPVGPDWAGGLRDTWTPGEAAAHAKLHDFLKRGLPRYGEERNEPALDSASGLSPYLRHGELSPRQVLAEARTAAEDGRASQAEIDKFASEVIWRDFDYDLLVQHPDLAWEAVNPSFATFPYRSPAPDEFRAWKTGQTGYPIVDAGMRQLWLTGVMHNRVRMIAASFLIKHMLVDWRLGEEWFWDTLCDADPANNPANWQWVAGCGVDPSPYFRIFNPVSQGERYDPKGTYVSAFVPELVELPARWIHHPWDAPPEVLAKAGVVLGETYPRPLVEHGPARARALEALASMRKSRPSQGPS